MARFASTQTSEGTAIGTLADAIVAESGGVYTAKTVTTSYTLTVSELINGTVLASGTPGAHNVTTPTAAQIVAAIPNCQVNSRFVFALVNRTDNTATILAGSGVTLPSGPDYTVATNTSQLFIGHVTATGTPAVTIVGLLATSS